MIAASARAAVLVSYWGGAMQGASLVVRLFGPLSIGVGGRRLGPDEVGGAKPRRVLEVLLLARGARVSKDRLIDAVWGDRAPHGAVGALETHVSVLRSRLELPRPGPLVADGETYGLTLPHGALDLDEFDDHLQRALAPGDDAREHLTAALRLASHDLLEDEPYAEWAIRIRDRYRSLVHDASLALAEMTLLAGDPAQAVLSAEIALGRDRLSERAARALMRGMFALGRQGDALLTYRRIRTTLRAELGVAPMDETVRLAGSIRRHDRAAVDAFGEGAPALVVPPIGQEIAGTRLGDHLDWMPVGPGVATPSRH